MKHILYNDYNVHHQQLKFIEVYFIAFDKLSFPMHKLSLYNQTGESSLALSLIPYLFHESLDPKGEFQKKIKYSWAIDNITSTWLIGQKLTLFWSKVCKLAIERCKVNAISCFCRNGKKSFLSANKSGNIKSI